MKTSHPIRPGEKKAWTTPRLQIHGSLEKLTLRDKTIGPTDGFFLMGVGLIRDAS